MIDGFLVAATVFSLSIAVIMAVITWRVIRLDRRQTTARADLGSRVARNAEEPTDTLEPPTWPPVRRDVSDPHQAFPRQAVAERRADAADLAWADLVIVRTAASEQTVATERRKMAEAPVPLTPPASASGSSRRLRLMLGAGALVVTSAIGSALISSERPDGLAFVSPAAARVALPLELVSLDSARDGDRVTVRGLVKNPAAGNRVEHLQAVIFLFDRHGMYLGTTQAAVVKGDLPPGSESWFEVPLATGLPISRYRVSFRLATAPVPYIDRRPVRVPSPAGNGKPAVDQRADLALSPDAGQ